MLKALGRSIAEAWTTYAVPFLRDYWQKLGEDWLHHAVSMIVGMAILRVVLWFM